MTEEKREAKASDSPEEDFDRITPQNIFDQSETFQVGGTVINKSLNRLEYAVEPDAPEKHNFNELDPENDAYDQEKHDKVAEFEDNMVQRRRRAKKSSESADSSSASSSESSSSKK